MVIVGCVVWGWAAHLVSTGWVICACSTAGLGKNQTPARLYTTRDLRNEKQQIVYCD